MEFSKQTWPMSPFDALSIDRSMIEIVAQYLHWRRRIKDRRPQFSEIGAGANQQQ
jgi:hypothetical protein